MSAKCIAASLALLGLAPLALAATGGTLEFEDLPGDGYYPAPNSFVTEGITVDVNAYDGGSGGQAQTDSPSAPGSGQGIFVENVKLDFQFPFPLSIVGFAFAHFGGEVRLCVNGVEVSSSDFFDFDGTTVGGANVSVSPLVVRGGGNSFGYATVVGNITQFAIGSEDGEFDDVRYVVPAPGAGIGLLGFGAFGLSRRRR